MGLPTNEVEPEDTFVPWLSIRGKDDLYQKRVIHRFGLFGVTQVRTLLGFVCCAKPSREKIALPLHSSLVVVRDSQDSKKFVFVK